LTQIVNVNFRPLKVECDDCGSQWEGVLHSKCPVCGSYYD
jgi:Zn finger protein HypA/HybF involved in hydrogenase expression